MISQEGKRASSRTRVRGRAAAAVVGVLILLAAAVGARGVGSPAQAASVADLAQLRDQAVAVLDRAQIKGRTGYSVGIDPSLKRIGVYLFIAHGSPLPDLAGLRASLGAEVDLHTVPGRPHLQGDIWAGESIDVDDDRNECTTGFAVTLRDGRQGFLTAGHCFDRTRPANQQPAHTHDGLPMTGLEYNVGPSDWGIYTLDNTTDEALAEVDTGDQYHPVRAVVSPSIGMPICKMGTATETTCGKITLLDTEAVYDPQLDANGVIIVPSARIKGLIQDDLCSEEGDSGSPIYTAPAQGQNAPVNAVAVLQGGEAEEDAAGNNVCLEKLGFANVDWAVPLATISSAATHPITIKTSG